jgi:hypothetical protein
VLTSILASTVCRADQHTYWSSTLALFDPSLHSNRAATQVQLRFIHVNVGGTPLLKGNTRKRDRRADEMSAPPRSANACSRTGSLCASSRDIQPPVIAHKGGSSLPQRPPLAVTTAAGGGVIPPSSTAAVTAATRSASTAKGKKSSSGAKPRVAPLSAAAKRIAAKGTSLRTRMPYLRPNAAPLPTEPTDSKGHPQHPPHDALPYPPHRSFSTSASVQRSVPWLKPSYAAIPAALQLVKKLCNASKDAAEEAVGSSSSSSVALVGSGNPRERRMSRPTNVSGGKGHHGGMCEEAATVVQNMEIIQGMLFSSLQTTVTMEVLTPLSPQHDAAPGAGGSHFQRSKSCNSQLESPLISSASGVFLSRKARRKAWELLLHKHTHAFPILVNAARSPLAVRETKVEATILTFLYNVLRHMAGERQRKAVLLCEKLGLIRVCTAVLQEHRRLLRFEAATSASRAACLRSCEAAGLLFTLGNTFNSKLSAAFRLSRSLDSTVACALSIFAVLEVEFAAFQQAQPLGRLTGCNQETLKTHGEAHTRKETLKALRSFQTRTQGPVTAFSHFCFTMFVFTSNAASAKELGTRGAQLCATAVAMTTYFLSQVTPALLTNVVYDGPEDVAHPAVGPLVAVDPAYWAPTWVVKMLRHVELMLLWCVALLHRLGSCEKVRDDVAAAALRSHVPRGCLVYLVRPSKYAAPQLAPRRECVHLMLLLLNTLLDADRAGVLADMSDLGGLTTLVTSVLKLSEPAAQQWHHYYIQLSTMYGCFHLPTIAGCAACYVDQRIPATLRRLDLAKDDGHRVVGGGSTVVVVNDAVKDSSVASASLPVQSADSAALTTAAAQPSPCAAALSPEGAAHALGGTTGSTPSSHISTAVTQSLSAADKYVSAPDVVLSPLFPCTAGGTQDDWADGLLLVDTKPTVFSPELHHGVVDPASALSDFTEGQPLPWSFTEAAPPTTTSHWQGKSSRIESVAEDDHLKVPLTDVPQEDRVRVLRHHIARLARLDGNACDSTPHPHAHKIVFERRCSADTGAAELLDAVVQPSNSGIVFFSDFESGNLQRVVEVADNEFDLVLAWDTATNSYTQWFNFGVRGFTPGKTYHFNILNMEKLGSTFNEGQKPLLLHVPDDSGSKGGDGVIAGTSDSSHTDKEATRKACAPHWQRVGHNIFYFRNTYQRPVRTHFFSKDVAAGGECASSSVVSPVGGGSAGGNNGGMGATTQATPTISVPQRFSPVRSAACSPARRLSPSRTPLTPPPVVAKKRVPVPTTCVTPPPFAGHYQHNPSNNAGNHTKRGDDGNDGGKRQKTYFTVTFSVTMPAVGGGRVYIANCFPFTYTELRQHLSWLAAHAASLAAAPSPSQQQQQQHNNTHAALSVQSLCVTPGGLEVPLLTVTALHHRDTGVPYSPEEIRRRPVALLVARVHPGETNASWVMQGLLDALVLPTAATMALSSLLCETFVLKIVPMLNVDGVMMGNHRCSFAGIDMNRDYLEPSAELNPTLYALKQLLRYWRNEEGRQIVMFADFHGHSRAKNFLVYGCTSETMRGVAHHLGRKEGSKAKGHPSNNGGGGRRRRRQVRVRQLSTDAPLGPEKFLAALLNHIFPSFSLSQSSYAVTKDKVSSARVVLCEEFGVRMSYGFEATMVGGRLSVPDLLQPLSKAANITGTLWREEVHYSPVVFRAMGEAFIRAFAALCEQWISARAAAAAAVATDSSNHGSSNCSHGSSEETHPCGCSGEVAQALWAATAAAGSGRDAPQGRSEELTKDVPSSSSEPRAGPYAIATRGDRRQGTNAASLSTATTLATTADAVPHVPAVSAAGQLDALNYLFLADQREAALREEGDVDGDGDEEEEDDQRTVDGSEVSSAVEGSDAHGDNVLVRNAAGKGRPKKVGYSGEGSEVGERSPSSALSDSGSDDHDWSGFNSSASSEAGDNIDVERSSASSVDDEIPTNLFM